MKDYFSFKRMITRPFISTIHILGMVAIIFIAICFVIADTSGGWLIALGILIFGLFIWRLMCEAWILFWSIHEALEDCRKSLRKLAGEKRTGEEK
ncbi:MAG: DUF4282 domain-containing protein [Defluviitaleaceae bacterium]|nr:DUF4282 domain-containing protein [Defluviitaleaceae bacterium]